MMQDYVLLMPQMRVVRFLEGLVAKYWIPSNILTSKFRVHKLFFIKDLQLLRAASKKLGGHNFLD